MKWNAGLITRNEARVAMGMKAFEGEGGDDLAPVTASAPAMIEEKAMQPADRYDELRGWWEKFGPEDAQGILDAESIK
jgi:hypothetical protein